MESRSTRFKEEATPFGMTGGQLAPALAAQSPAALFAWLDGNDRNADLRVALANSFKPHHPNYIPEISFALFCNIVKEMGYLTFVKPDVQLKDFAQRLRIANLPDNDECVFRAFVRLARSANVTPFAADKLFWLIGTGNFHYHQLDLRTLKAALLNRVAGLVVRAPNPPECGNTGAAREDADLHE